MIDENRTSRLAALFAELAELLSDYERADVPTPRPAPDHMLLTVEEAAEQLRIGRTRMFALLKSGEIESVLIGRSRRIHPDAIEEYARRLQNHGEKDSKTS